MRTGELNKRLTFLREQKTPDGYGGMTTTWGTVTTVWAAVWPIKTSEYVQGMQIIGEVTHRARIRYRKDITADMRFTMQSRTFIITGPPMNLNEGNKFLEMLCKELK